jgi:hypothetical protein
LTASIRVVASTAQLTETRMSGRVWIAWIVVAAVLVAIGVFTAVEARVHHGQCWNNATSRWTGCPLRDG